VHCNLRLVDRIEEIDHHEDNIDWSSDDNSTQSDYGTRAFADFCEQSYENVLSDTINKLCSKTANNVNDRPTDGVDVKKNECNGIYTEYTSKENDYMLYNFSITNRSRHWRRPAAHIDSC